MGAGGHTGWRLLLWLGVAVLAHVLVALFGVLNRWLQVKPSPPLPALRLALLVSLLSLGSVAILDGLTQAARAALHACHKRCSSLGWPRQHQWQQTPEPPKQSSSPSAKEANDADAVAGWKDGRHCLKADGSCLPIDIGQQQADDTDADDHAAVQPCPQHRRPPSTWYRQDSSFVCQPGQPLPPRPELALARGLSHKVQRLSSSSPRLVYWGALALTTVSFATAFTCQVVAPGFIDPSILQLVNMFTVIGVALVQRLLLHQQLPPIIWPASGLMLAGATMVIVPSIGKGAVAGLDGWRGWLGFGLSLCSMFCTVIYFVSLQAFRRLGFTSLQLQYCFLCINILVLLPLSLPINGTDWGSQFEAWDTSSWAVLALTSCVVCVGANLAIQHATWQIGAPTLSMFYGLRLIASIVQSKVILSYTIITKGVQIAGSVITVAAVTWYMFVQWKRSRHAAETSSEKEAKVVADAIEEGMSKTQAAQHNSSVPTPVGEQPSRDSWEHITSQRHHLRDAVTE